MMTILRNEDRPGGLQVRRRDGQWIAAPAIDNTFVVNLGDLMMRWTNDRWLSTPHRVIEPPAEQRAGSRRMSIGFFVGPNYDAMVECLPGCSDTAHPAKYEPVSAHDYRTGRFAAGAGLKTAVGE
jgi:isopenicillin N synthase-like dioxygenase